MLMLPRVYCLAGMILLSAAALASAQDDAATERVNSVANYLRRLDVNVLGGSVKLIDDSAVEPAQRLAASIREKRRRFNEADVRTWRSLKNREDWERLRDARLQKLQDSLGQFPNPPDDLHVRVTKTLDGDGFQIDCIVFESRPGLLVTANLYRPAEPPASMPGILICHSHHNPKTQAELQDMGMIWARQGCVVLVMDQLGHGERRQHPFRSAGDFPHPFRVSRQDYHFRYNVGMQLHLIGDSLIGWMVWDLMRGVDLLLDQPGIDPQRIILLGAVAGGGDPAAVTAALDRRIVAAVPFNFGGPQPENVFPLSDDAELSFNYIGGGSWESTRNLQRCARDGFLPWVIVGAIAPRGLIYAHEFRWDREHDPVWKRLQQLYAWYDAPEKLASLSGYGRVTLSSQEASHCNNIGTHHRQQIYPALARWFGMPVPDEYRDRREPEDLNCVEGVEAAAGIELKPAHRLADQIARERIGAFRRKQAEIPPAKRKQALRDAWLQQLGWNGTIHVTGLEPQPHPEGPVRLLPVRRGTDDGNMISAVVLFPQLAPDSGCPLVIAVCQSGKQAMLAARADEVARLLDAGIAVALVDLRGCGETQPEAYRGRRSDATGLSSSALMLGDTLLGQRLNDFVHLSHYLAGLSLIDRNRIALWGDSLAEPNTTGRPIAAPLGIDDEPDHSEPLGATLALLTPMFVENIQAVLARGGLVSIRSCLDSEFMHVPHDFIVPGILTAGDLADAVASQSPLPMWIERVVDGTNRPASRELVDAEWSVARRAYQETGAETKLIIGPDSPGSIGWLIQHLAGPQD